MPQERRYRTHRIGHFGEQTPLRRPRRIEQMMHHIRRCIRRQERASQPPRTRAEWKKLKQARTWRKRRTLLLWLIAIASLLLFISTAQWWGAILQAWLYGSG